MRNVFIFSRLSSNQVFFNYLLTAIAKCSISFASTGIFLLTFLTDSALHIRNIQEYIRFYKIREISFDNFHFEGNTLTSRLVPRLRYISSVKRETGCAGVDGLAAVRNNIHKSTRTALRPLKDFLSQNNHRYPKLVLETFHVTWCNRNTKKYRNKILKNPGLTSAKRPLRFKRFIQNPKQVL